jgi:diguanylate cyclase (GGDEF)-like protein
VILGRKLGWMALRWLRALAGVMAATAACVVVGAGLLPDLRGGRPPALGVALTAALVIVVAGAVAARLRFVAPSARAQRVSPLAALAPALADVELALALAAGGGGAVAITGGQASPLVPLLYLVVAFEATFLSRPGVVAGVGAAVLLALAAAVPGGRLDAARVPAAAEQAAYLALAAAAHLVFLRGLVLRQKREHDRTLRDDLRRRREEAREFRLIASALSAESRAPRSREEERQRLAEGAVESIHASMFHTLELLKASLDLHTCVLLWLDDSGARLKIKELVTDSDCVVETPIGADAGALGAIVRERLMLNLPQPKRGHVPYYAGPEEVGAFLGVPVVEDGHLRGVLCADRRGRRPFSEADEKLLAGAAQQILRALQNERVFVAVERSKYEHERFYKASAMLGRALTLEQVMDTAFEAAREIVEFDLASISLFDKDKRRHRICRVRVQPGAEDLCDVEQLDGLEFPDGSSLTAMVLKNRHYLPAGGELRDTSTPVYSRKVRLKNADSLLVLPLIAADEAIGTFTLAARRSGAFGKDARDMLGVIANQVAVSLENAKMYRQMETMATTDGLTGLLNHRTFQERLSEMLGRAERMGTKLCIMLTDVDHFKKVNDTYGHPVGDQVLKRVAQVCQEKVRKIDIVARYGGEEFAIVLENTDAAGALQLAERVRLDVGKQQFNSDKGTFHVTLSLGIACYPMDAKEKHALIERADQALYFAKHNGRNRSVSYEQFLVERAQKSKKAV